MIAVASGLMVLLSLPDRRDHARRVPADAVDWRESILEVLADEVAPARSTRPPA
jgi:hypothetical protein